MHARIWASVDCNILLIRGDNVKFEMVNIVPNNKNYQVSVNLKDDTGKIIFSGTVEMSSEELNLDFVAQKAKEKLITQLEL